MITAFQMALELSPELVKLLCEWLAS